jgi:hypothetical protein
MATPPRMSSWVACEYFSSPFSSSAFGTNSELAKSQSEKSAA